MKKKNIFIPKAGMVVEIHLGRFFVLEISKDLKEMRIKWINPDYEGDVWWKIRHLFMHAPHTYKIISEAVTDV
jgi:hypothetical protein